MTLRNLYCSTARMLCHRWCDRKSCSSC